MRIGLIDVDGHSGFPNLALMKLSAMHKAKGDTVELYSPMFSGHLDRVYMSKIFTFTKDYEYFVDADEVITGGTGYKDYVSVLPDEAEHIFPDYSIYPDCNYAIGFLTRGCIRSCPWCVVPKKEGKLQAYDTWQNIKRPDSKEIRFLDNNVLASPHGIAQIEELRNIYIDIDFNQGMDARLIDKPMAKILSEVRWRPYLRISCDTTAMIPVVEKAVGYLTECGMHPRKIFAYTLVQDVDESYERIMALKKLNIEIFAQPYRDFEGGEPTREKKRLARWVNMKAVFRSVEWKDYNK